MTNFELKNKMEEKATPFITPASVRDRLRKISSILCPSFCPRKERPVQKNEEIAPCILSKKDLLVIYKHLELDEEDGVLPYKLHCAWEGFMPQELLDTWALHIFGSRDDIVPNERKFCELVKGQWFGPLDKKVKTVLAIVMHKDHEEIKKANLKVSKYDVLKYFQNIMVTYIRAMSYNNNPEFLKWVRRNADLRENNLRLAIAFFSFKLPEMVGEQDLYSFMKTYQVFRDVLTSVIEMCFGISKIYNSIIPFPKSSSQTILDMSQIVLLNSLVRDSYEQYEWEMLFSTNEQGYYDMFFIHSIVKKGPTILVIQDEEGWIFGGYAARSWRIGPKFFGDERSFLFRLEPTFALFPSAKKNDNYMYLNEEALLPKHNGLGMGGTLDSFGLWVSLGRNVGKCGNYCDTFVDFECLSCNNNFHYVNLEVWRVSRLVTGPLERNSRSMARVDRPVGIEAQYLI